MISGSTRFFLMAGVMLVSSVVGWAAEPIRIMPVGDSITVGCTNLPGQPEVPFEYGWRAGLYTQLTNAGYSFQYVGSSDHHPTPGVSYTGPDLAALGQDYHNSVGGMGSAWVSENITGWIRDSNPDVILLMIGINDIPQYSTAQPYVA